MCQRYNIALRQVFRLLNENVSGRDEVVAVERQPESAGVAFVLLGVIKSVEINFFLGYAWWLTSIRENVGRIERRPSDLPR